jgi:hypothetical protein
MNPHPSISYDLAQARIADLRHRGRREGVTRAAQPDRRRIPGLRAVLRHRVAS